MKKVTYLIALLVLLMMGGVAVIAQDALIDEEEELLDCPAFEDSPTEVRIGYYMGEGEAYENSGQLASAIFSYSCLIQQVDENYVQAYINRALLHTSRRSFDLAIEDYTTILELESDNVAAINNRGLMFMARQEMEEALADFDLAIETNPEYIPAYVNRGVYYASEDNFDLALDDFQSVIDLAGLQAVIDWIEAPSQDEDGNPIDKGERPEYDATYARVYAMMGVLDAMDALDDWDTYFRLVGNADRRIQSAAGSFESQLQFDLRFDDGTWVIFDDFVKPESEEETE